jgi:N-acetyl-gamma-glutamylphosphate reductase
MGSADALQVSIVGGSGYAGGELLRILLRHPGVRINQVTSRRHAGAPVSILHPNLRGLTDLAFVKPDDVGPCDLLFLGLPNGESMHGMEGWMARSGRIIDLGADFRLKTPEAWKTWYGTDHARPESSPSWRR